MMMNARLIKRAKNTRYMVFNRLRTLVLSSIHHVTASNVHIIFMSAVGSASVY
jgi:hypothetical protein